MKEQETIDTYKELHLKLTSGNIMLLMEVLDILIAKDKVPTPYCVAMCEVLQKIILQYYEQMGKDIKLVSYLDSMIAKNLVERLSEN